jgi:acyl-coenzyme A synthetase/AMP-(fatty) acid ligase
VNTIATPAERAWWPHSAGRPFEGTRLAVLAPDLTPLPPGRAGRVAVSSYMNMDGYASHPTPEVRLDGERHLVTGDHGWLDRDGRLYLLSREDGLPEAGSGDVFGVEGTLKAIAGVRDVALVRLPHDGGTTLVAAYVDGDPDRRPSTAERLRRSLRRAFPGLSTEAAAVPGIPYSPTGKVRVETLRAMLERPAAPAAASMEVRS